MDFQKYTIKSQEVIQVAQQSAESNGNAQIETAHLFEAILTVDEHVTPYLLKKFDVNIKILKDVISSIVGRFAKVQGQGTLYFSNDSKKILVKAQNYLTEFKDEFVSIELMLLSFLSVRDQIAEVLKDNGITEKGLKTAISDLRKGDHVTSSNQEETYNSLSKYAKNLNQLAQDNKLDPVIGRDEEIRRVLQILSRRTKNNPILIGEPGVGKTAIAEGIAHRIIKEDVPENLKSKIIFSLDIGALIAGAKFKGEFEERLKAVVKEVISANGDIVLFIDEIHTLVGAGGGEGAMDAANILKPALARGELKAVGATTLDEYQKYFEKDKALERRFQKVIVDEPSTDDSISILRGIKEKYEAHHKVLIKDEAILAAVHLSQRYISDRFLPDKAIDLIDEAASKLRMEINSKPEELDEIERRIMQLEIERAAILRESDDRKKNQIGSELAQLNEKRSEFIAKWQAEKDIVDQIQQLKEEIEQFKLEAETAEREGNFGVVAELRYGKIKDTEAHLNELKQQLIEVQSVSKMIKEEVDAEEIADVVSKWTGIPINKMLETEKSKLLHLEDRLRERVIGQEEAITAVSDAVRRSRAGLQDANKPIGSFIFLGSTGVGKTELAKALSEFLFNDEKSMTRIDMSEYQEKHSVSKLVGAPPGYVGYEEGGQLTEAVRRKPYSVILLDEIEKAHPDVFNTLLQVLDDGRLTDNKGRLVNFKNTIIIMTSNLGSDIIQSHFEEIDLKNPHSLQNQMELAKIEVFELLKRSLRPEFLNRIDESILFNPLGSNFINEIVKIQLRALQKTLKEKEILLDFSNEAIIYLSKRGYDPQFGARPVKRVIQKEVLNELSKAILGGTVLPNKSTIMDVFDEKIIFRIPINAEIIS